jgi:hypothetical protein
MKYYRITISDNDFWFLMDNTIKYVCFCLKFKPYKTSELSKEEIIKEIITEYLDEMHTSIDIKNYILKHLNVSIVDSITVKNENSEVYYVYYEGEDNYKFIKQ